ncbi:MAG: serine/threonine protein kinase, partial [Burkholderiales bacterium]
MSLKKLGRYDLVRVLGKGAMGIVYEGRDPNLDRRVAIKTVKVENLSEGAAAEYEARFRTEARSAARLQHPNIVSVYDSDRDGDVAFLVMEYIHGDDLKHHLDRGVRYSLEQSLKMVRELLSALDYAHKQGIVHRDIKPANLLLEPGGRVKLTDFGVARIQDSGEATRTQGSMVGTLKYMSPEQVQGQKIDSRADLFSVGVMLYQLLTDKRPFDGDNDFSIIHQIIGHTPAAPSSINSRLPTAIDAVVARALAKDREERFATARDFAAALQSAMRRAEDATVVPPADPLRKADNSGSAASVVPTTPGAVSGTSNGSSPATVTQELELVYWKDIKDSVDVEELEGFLVRFPEGIYADLARRRMRKLAGGANADPTAPFGTNPLAAAAADLDATRMRADASRPALPASSAEPTPDVGEGSDFTATVSEPRAQDGRAPAGETEPAPGPVTGAAAPAEAPAFAPVPPFPALRESRRRSSRKQSAVVEPEVAEPPEKSKSRKDPILTVVFGASALIVAGLAALLWAGRSPQKPIADVAAARPAASSPAPEAIAAPSMPATLPVAANASTADTTVSVVAPGVATAPVTAASAAAQANIAASAA